MKKNVYFCDLCGVQIDKHPHSWPSIHPTPTESVPIYICKSEEKLTSYRSLTNEPELATVAVQIDICIKCMEEFYRFVNGRICKV